MELYEKYVVEHAKVRIKYVDDELRAKVKEHMARSAADPENTLPNDMYQTLKDTCFRKLLEKAFNKFQRSAEFNALASRLVEAHGASGHVTVNDFEYMGILGRGGFGRVVHARKISTGKHYAMKIQLKTGLLHEHRKDYSQLDTEKNVFSACHFPFIVDLQYALQTPAHAILVLGLVTGGDLEDAMLHAKQHRLPEDRVRLYVAEILLALRHLHEMKIVYRDLKPGNILLRADGHCQLADMGLAAEIIDETSEAADGVDGNPEGAMEGVDENQQSDASVAAAALTGGVGSNRQSRRSSMLVRKNLPLPKGVRKSIVGTPGYMAPELLEGAGKRRQEREGYAASVDYWALGVTMYEMLTGELPFLTPHNHNEGMEWHLMTDAEKDVWELEQVKKQVQFPDYISEDARDLIRLLLHHDLSQRLGCTREGIEQVKRHQFFSSIQWDQLMVREMEATYRPKLHPISERPKFRSYQQMMAAFDAKERSRGKHDWNKAPPEEHQRYFETWDYVSPYSLLDELDALRAKEEKGGSGGESTTAAGTVPPPDA